MPAIALRLIFRLHSPTPTSATEQEMRTWASAAAPAGEHFGTGRSRLGSIGNPQKRARKEEEEQQYAKDQQRVREQQYAKEEQEKQFQLFLTRNQQKKQRKVAYGSSQVNIEEEGSAAPVEYYIGNTTPRATKEII